MTLTSASKIWIRRKKAQPLDRQRPDVGHVEKGQLRTPGAQNLEVLVLALRQRRPAVLGRQDQL